MPEDFKNQFGAQPVSGGSPTSQQQATSPSPVQPQPASQMQASPTQPQPTGSSPVLPPTEPSMQPSGSGPVAPKKPKKGLLIGGIIAAALVILSGGAVAAYNLWYQNPDKVLADAISNALQAKTTTFTGSLSVTGDQDIQLELTGGSNEANGELDAKLIIGTDGQDLTVSGAARIIDNKDVYVKIDATELVSELSSDPSLGPVVDMYGTLVEKYKDQWIKFDLTGMDGFEDYAKTQECVQEAFAKLKQDDVSKDILSVYKENKFIVVKEELGVKDGSLGFVYDVDQEKSKSFAAAISEKDYIKDFEKCGDDAAITTDDIIGDVTDGTGSDNTRVEVWISQFSHEFTKISLSGQDEDVEIKVILEPKFNQEVSVEAPSDSMTVEELYEALMEDLMSQYTAPTNYELDGFDA